MLELAHQLIRINEMNDYNNGFTLAPTCMFSGTVGTCQVPEDGWFSMDVRFRTEQIANEMHPKILALQPITKNTRLEVTGAIDKPPMRMDSALFEKAKAVGRELGIELEGRFVGGGSDGNYTSAAGVPTLDGMGMTGILLHNPGEYINISHVPTRGALLTKLLTVI